MITELLPTLQAPPPHPLLNAYVRADGRSTPDCEFRDIVALEWSNDRPGTLCSCVDSAERLTLELARDQEELAARPNRRTKWAKEMLRRIAVTEEIIAETRAEALELVKTLTPDEIVLLQAHAPARIRRYVVDNMAAEGS